LGQWILFSVVVRTVDSLITHNYQLESCETAFGKAVEGKLKT